MPIGAVLVDRARSVKKEAASQRVEGTTTFAPVVSAQFRCRLFLPGGNESVAPSPPGGDGRTKSVERPQLMWDRRGPELSFDQQVEVTSTELGCAIWKIRGTPEKIRKKRRVIGYLANLERVREGTFEEVGD